MSNTEKKLLEALAYLADNVDEDCPTECRTTHLDEALLDARALVAEVDKMNATTHGGTMIRRDEPTPAIHAESLRSMLNNSSMWDRKDPDTSLTDLLADIMHLIDAEECNSFDALCERARRHYTAEVEELEDRQKGRRL